MELNLKNLEKVGAFVGPPIQKTIKWKNPDADGVVQEFEATTYVRQNSCATFDDDIRAHVDGKKSTASKIHSTVCDANGQPIAPYEKILEFSEGLTAALLNAIIEVNSPKNSKPPTNSGTN